MNQQCVLYRCHFLDESVWQAYDQLKEQLPANIHLVLLYDNSRNDFKSREHEPSWCYTADHLRSLGYYVTTEEDRRLEGAYVPPLIWYHSEYPILHFWQSHQTFDHIWCIEFDVRFTGHWSTFFERYKWNDADFLATHIVEYSDWPDWKNFRRPAKIAIPKENWVKAFFPLVRLSRQAAEYLHASYTSGTWGYTEIIVPTVLRSCGCTLHDIFQDENPFASEETFRWKPVFDEPDGSFKKDTLYHPVRTEY